jgi:hypothetical protein
VVASPPGGRIVHRLAAPVILCTALVAPTAAAAAPIPQTAVRAKPPPVNEQSPSAAAGYLAWEQNSRLRPGVYNVYAQAAGGARFRVNAPGTQAGLGTGIQGHTLAYTQVRGTRSSIRLFDLRTHRRYGPPAGVNTPHAESEPSISGGRLLYLRRTGGARPVSRVLLADIHTGAVRVIDTVSGRRAFLEAGQVDGGYAVYTKSIGGGVSNVWLYDISTGHVRMVPNPAGRTHSAPAVNASGTVYFEESGRACGAGVRIDEYPVGGPVIVEGTLNPGIDLFHPSVYENGPEDDYLFAKLRCRSGATDVYEVRFS